MRTLSVEQTEALYSMIYETCFDNSISFEGRIGALREPLEILFSQLSKLKSADLKTRIDSVVMENKMIEEKIGKPAHHLRQQLNKFHHPGKRPDLDPIDVGRELIKLVFFFGDTTIPEPIRDSFFSPTSKTHDVSDFLKVTGEDLNSQQRVSVESEERITIVQAGAGTGKTHLLKYRAIHQCEKLDESGGFVHVITFTNKAAEELRTRLHSLVDTFDISPDLVRISTIHGFALSLLKDFGDQEYDKFSIITQIEESNLIQSRTVKNREETDFMEFKRELRMITFDDIIYEFKRNLETEDFKQNVLARVRYLLVDEFQDVDDVQYDCFSLLINSSQLAFTAVGDDLQSIYSFRGANYKVFERLKYDFPTSREFWLTLNYRSTKPILKFANQIRFELSKPKKLESVVEGDKPRVVRCDNDRDEATYVASRISELINSGTSPSDIGVLVRYRNNSEQLQFSLFGAEIPYYLLVGPSTTTVDEIDGLVALVDASINIKRITSWIKLKYLCGLKSSIGRDEQMLKSLNEFQPLLIQFDSYKNSKWTKILKAMDKLRSDSFTSELLIQVINWFVSEFEIEDENGCFEELKDLATASDSLARFRELINSEGERRGLVVSMKEPDEPHVTISTIHASKGRQWEHVFVLNATDSVYPSYKSVKDNFGRKQLEAIEEDKRLFYVSITRAIKSLTISYPVAGLYPQYPNRLSRFIRLVLPIFYEPVSYPGIGQKQNS